MASIGSLCYSLEHFKLDWGVYPPSSRLVGGASEHKEPPEAILDAFDPAKPIVYFRFERDRDPPYDVRDNPIDPTCANGFASQEHFELLVRPKDAEGNRKWVREDYLLISPGPDRYYGYVVKDEATGRMRPARQEDIDNNTAYCDDITNFRY